MSKELLVTGIVKEADAIYRDAARYRWLLKKLQESYDGEAFENDEPTIYCHMNFGRKEVRRMHAEISWFDVRDEPLNLSAAIDQALTKEQAT